MTSAIQYLNLRTGERMALTPSEAVLASSAHLDWSRVAVAERQLLVPQFRPEHGILGHRAFVNLGPLTDFSWGDAGRRQRGPLSEGGLHVQAHGAVNAPGWTTPLHTLSLAFDPDWLAAQAATFRSGPLVRERRNLRDPDMHALASALAVELTSTWPDPLRGSALLVTAALRLLGAHGAGAPAGEALGPARARAALEAIEEGLEGRLTVAKLGAAVGLSEARFARGFALRFGVPPHCYVLARRIARARALLSRGEPAAAVATRCGFHDQAHLTRMFRAAVGTPPAEWARTERRSFRIRPA